MPTVREYEQTLQKEPAQTEAFVALRKAYREAGKFDKLVTLYECRAQAIEDSPKAAELFYLAAEVRIDHLDDTTGAEADLAHAVARDAGHPKATRRLKDIYRQQGRAPEYLGMLELEAAAVARSKDPTRVAELQTEMGQLEAHTLAPIERTLANPARRGDVAADVLKPIESARKVYRALGDFANVVRLFELELTASSDAKRRAELLLGLGRVLGEKLGDLDGAAQRIGEVVRLRPRDDKALEALATVYANPKWAGTDGPDRAAALYHQVARRRHEGGDTDNAVAALRKALGAVPGHAEASELLERVLYDAERLPDLDRYYRERVAGARTTDEKMDFLFKRAQLAEGELNAGAEALRVYEEIVAIEPPGGPASQHLAQLYQDAQEYAKLAELREKQLEVASDPAFRMALLQELAVLYRDRLGDREQAAVYLHAILQMDPANPEALHAYAEHFRQRGDWRELADLLEFSMEHQQASGAPAEELLPRLEEIATIVEGKLGDTERALVAWQKIEAMAPGYERAREAQKRILQKGKQWDRMAAVLKREAEGATEPAQRIEILRRLARITTEKLAAPDQAAAVYQQILALDPRDVVALRALVDSFERGERWGELAKLLRDQLELASAKQEKLTLLRRLLALYDDRLADLAEGSWAAAEILKLVPGDRDALTRLEGILERSDDKARLVQTLEYHTRYAATTEEKIQLARRIADLLQNHLGEVERATAYWEQLVRLQPGDSSALEALAGAYDKLGRPEDLARVLEQQIQRSSGDAGVQAECLRRLARLFGETLKQPARAQRAWEDLLRLVPTEREALEALSVIAHGKGDWRTLVVLLERRVPLADDPAVAIGLALERARVFEVDLRNADEAMRALEQIITELDPRSGEAHARLRRVAEAKGDWARVVGVAERQLFLTEDPGERAGRGLEIGALHRDKLRDAKGATAAFERVLEIQPDNLDALYALAPLYSAGGDAERLIFTDERLLQHAEDADERRRLMFELADTCEGGLGEPRLAFEWFRRAYQEGEDEEALGRLERVAEAHGLWEDLVQVYAGGGARTSDPDEQVEVAMKVAALCEQRLRSPTRAFAVLRDALASEPAGTRLLPELERLAAETRDWPSLLEVHARVARARPAVEDRVALLWRRAAVREERMGDPAGALEEHLRSFTLNPDSADTQQEILRLAEATGRWEDALAVQGQLFTRAATTELKVAVARHAAALVEEKVKDRVRAFRAYLNAFRLASQDEGIIANLWRLAALIGRYDDAVPGAEAPAPATVAAVSSAEEAGAIVDDADAEEFEELDETDAVEDLEEPAAAAPPLPVTTPVPVAARRGRPGFASPWEELANAYELLPAPDSETRLRHHKCIADVWERGAEDLDRALASLERAFQLDTRDDEVREDLRRLASTHDRWDEVCAIYLRAVDRSSREEAVALHLEVARFREDLGQTDAAEERYRSVLVLQPDHGEALDRLEHFCRAQERWSDLAGILEKRIAPASDPTAALDEEAPEPRQAAVLPPAAQRRTKSFELAELYEKRLERPYEAIDTLERYVAAIDEDERGFDHAVVIREACEAYEALVRLYSRVGLWQKSVSALASEIELTTDTHGVRDLRWRTAEIHERELGQPDQAIEAYEAILTTVPDDAEALTALDRLLNAHGRWEALQQVLERRAELASGPTRTELTRRRARVLEERLNNPDAAAACLRSLGLEALADDESTAALLRNLRSAGLGHEAARVITQRIDILTRAAAPPRALVALHLELAGLSSHELGDLPGARRAIEAALAALPEDPEVLAVLAKLHLEQNDFAAFAETRERQAKALGSAMEAAAALLEAGAVYRDQLGDGARARACFERAVAEHPDSPEALHALAALLAADGQLPESRALYERQLALVALPAAKAAVLTDLARVLWEKPGDAPAAIKRLDEALELAPDHLPAVITMADIYYKEQQWEQAERRLAQALRRLRGQPQQTGKLYHRLAEVYEKLGRLEEGYKQLLEAERVVPGQLLVRIALGENRFGARKWRECAQHLDGVADHPDAASYPDEVASAMAHAAQAEIKLKHPERAVALYQAALRFSPDHRPSLKALADLALERGEQREAAQYLRRMAESSGDRAERAHLHEQLGDLYQSLDDVVSARDAYEAAVATIDRPTEEHVPLLEKTLGLERAAGAVAEATETALRISSLVTDPRDRAVRRRDVAALLAEQGDHVRAADLLDMALADNPLDEDVLHKMAEVYEASGRATELEELLARRLAELPEVADKPMLRKRRAELWERLGRVRTQRDPEAAMTAFERAVDAEPERVSARVALAGLYDGAVNRPEAALQNLRMLVWSDVTRADALRALAASYLSQGRIDWARCCYEVLDLLGLAQGPDSVFLAAHPVPVLKPEDPYTGVIDDPDRDRYLAHPEARVMSEVFAAIWEGVPGLAKVTLDSLGVTAQDKISPISELDIGKIYGQAGKALGNKRTTLYINHDPTFHGVALVLHPPPAIVVDQRVGSDAGGVEMRFRIGRALELTRPEYILAATVAPREFAQLFSSVLKAFHPRHARWRAGTEGAEQVARLKKSLPYKASKRLVELFRENDATPFSSARWRAVVHETGHRAGLLMSGDLRVAARIVLAEQLKEDESAVSTEALLEQARQPGALRELLRYAVSEPYFVLRGALGTGISRAAAA